MLTVSYDKNGMHFAETLFNFGGGVAEKAIASTATLDDFVADEWSTEWDAGYKDRTAP